MSYFSNATFDFLRQLAANNNRAWFAEHKDTYLTAVRDPFLQLIAEIAPEVQKISPHYQADPKPMGGSLFRIYRDARFSSDKSPYKNWAGARIAHVRRKQTAAPSFYLHVAPDDCFVGGGIWQPEPPTLRKIRDFLVENPASWIKATRSGAFSKQLQLGGSSLVRPPRGFDPEHALIADVKRKDFVCFASLSETQICSKQLKTQVLNAFKAAAPMVDYLCAALDLEF
jgi:uncharacterized protein (TIGR02453 family)